MKNSLWTVVVVLLVVLGIAWYLGILSPRSTPIPPPSTTITTTEAPVIIPNVTSILYQDSQYNFTLYRPATAESKTDGFEGYLPLTQTPVVAFTLPKDLFTGTNLGEAGIYIGATTSPKILGACMSPDLAQGESATTTTRIVGGATFGVFTSTGVGAGNIYDTTALRTVHNGTCFEIVELLHSGRIENYTAGAVTAFDRPQFIGYLDAMANTFSFATSTTVTQ